MADYMLLLYAPDGDEAEQARRWARVAALGRGHPEPARGRPAGRQRPAARRRRRRRPYACATARRSSPTARLRSPRRCSPATTCCDCADLDEAIGGRRAAADRRVRLGRGAADHGHERHARARRGRDRAGVTVSGRSRGARTTRIARGVPRRARAVLATLIRQVGRFPAGRGRGPGRVRRRRDSVAARRRPDQSAAPGSRSRRRRRAIDRVRRDRSLVRARPSAWPS